MFKEKRFWILTFLLGLFLRTFHLGNLPLVYGNSLLRLFSAVSGSFSIILLYFFVLKTVKNEKIALFSSLAYALLPINLVEGRIISWIPVFSLILLSSGLLLIQKPLAFKITGLLLLVFSIVFFRNEFCLLENFRMIRIRELLTNIFNSISFNKIFFANDSYWVGGLRKYGMVFPEAIPLFLIGLYKAAREKFFLPFLFSSIVVLFASLNPFFPEARELGLLGLPLSFFIGLGFYSIRKYLFTFLGLIYFLILLYGMINFFHYYSVHYNYQISQVESDKLKQL